MSELNIKLLGELEHNVSLSTSNAERIIGHKQYYLDKRSDIPSEYQESMDAAYAALDAALRSIIDLGGLD